MEVVNTQAYYDTTTITAVKGFIVQATFASPPKDPRQIQLWAMQQLLGKIQFVSQKLKKLWQIKFWSQLLPFLLLAVLKEVLGAFFSPKVLQH